MPKPHTGIDQSPSVVVVTPTYNERDNIQLLIPAVLNLGPGYSMLIVDDNSPDGTGEIVERLAAASDGRVSILHRPEKQGIGPAYLAGFRKALDRQTDLIATMDADLSHQPNDLVRLVAAAADADLVLGSRYIANGATSGWPVYRRLISRLGGMYARHVLRVPVQDLTGGFKVYRRATLASLDLGRIKSDGYVFQIETSYRTIKRGFRVIEVPITFVDRVAGASKLSRRIVAEAIVMVWRLRFSKDEA